MIQFTPPGSGCSVIFGKNVTAAAPGSAQGLYLIVSDIEAAREIIHCILDLMYAKAPCAVMQRAMHIHPTVSDLIPTMMGDLVPLQ